MSDFAEYDEQPCGENGCICHCIRVHDGAPCGCDCPQHDDDCDCEDCLAEEDDPGGPW